MIATIHHLFCCCLVNIHVVDWEENYFKLLNSFYTLQLAQLHVKVHVSITIMYMYVQFNRTQLEHSSLPSQTVVTTSSHMVKSVKKTTCAN